MTNNTVLPTLAFAPLNHVPEQVKSSGAPGLRVVVEGALGVGLAQVLEREDALRSVVRGGLQ